jgi:uncharacterized protein
MHPITVPTMKFEVSSAHRARGDTDADRALRTRRGHTASVFVRRVFAAFALCLVASLVNAEDVPLLRGRVVDNASLLSSAARERVRVALKAHEDKTGNQLVVLTVPDLENDSIELYAVRVFNEWKLGEKGKDNGVLLVIAAKQGKARIEVGYGLEGSLPDVVAFRVIHNVMGPHLKVGHFDEGVEEGVATIVSQLEGNAAESPRDVQAQPSVTVSNSSRDANAQSSGSVAKIILGFFAFLVTIGIVVLLAAMVFQLGSGFMGWIAFPFLAPFVYVGSLAVVGEQGAMIVLLMYLIGVPIFRLSRQHEEKDANVALSGAGASSSSGSSDSDSSGGGSSGSNSSGDDFSGGGGRSGGGGSSDDFSSDDFGSDDRRDDSSDDDR